jgi:hypothetical protein
MDQVTATVRRDHASKAPSSFKGANTWLVTLRYQGRRASFAYYTGSAITDEPTAADVLTSLFMDASYAEDADAGAETLDAPTRRQIDSNNAKLRRLLGEDFDAFEDAYARGDGLAADGEDEDEDEGDEPKLGEIEWASDGRMYRLRVRAGLHKIGGQRPYFTITAELHSRSPGGSSYRSEPEACGCLHDEILQRFPDFGPLVDMHLADEDGVPMHAEANGWYWLAGALGGLDEQYHGSDSSNGRTRAECFDVFARLVRVTTEEARRIAADVVLSDAPREAWRWICASMLPRWKREADDAISRFGLRVFEDHGR